MMHSVRIILVSSLLWSALCISPLDRCFSQPTPASSSNRDFGSLSQNVQSASKPAADAALPDQTLGPDDLIAISVSYCPELSQNFRIAEDGTLSLPLLRAPLHVTGLNAVEVGRLIQHSLEEQQVLVHPIINVSVLEYRSRPVSVVGAVNHPLTFQVIGRTTLLDAIARAGGLSATAGPNITVNSRSPRAGQNGDHSMQAIPVALLMNGSNPTLNLELKGGEEIRIPEVSKVFVAGNVRRPGMYAMQTDSGTTLMKALALSEGLSPFTASTAYIYRVGDPGKERTELRVPLSRIMARKEPDMKLMPDDIVYIPENRKKRMTGSVLNRIAGFSENTATGLVIYH